ncbi:hypothetical protein PFISCL1PPCAC_29119 [Pristionchus fissidentatus]|uniref:F-box domain-containing protein n=1 Tax=Pristionchus fissidentatus TaxID=1538716 RepID=A0AAV5X016_9BILA|nr:hypothetical protein PFISCL1PPCAC_28904 [Pristionchus fissidentatus]GMT37822.1 hypothetical protein PFISCL1PPCAC_29119 [Pristionchus fissidentatus]
MAPSAKRQKLDNEHFPFNLLPNEIKSEICRCLTLKDRKSLGATCKLMYRLEIDAGGYEFDEVVAVQPGRRFELTVLPSMHHSKTLCRVPSEMKEQIFKQARIHHLDFSVIQ